AWGTLARCQLDLHCLGWPPWALPDGEPRLVGGNTRDSHRVPHFNSPTEHGCRVATDISWGGYCLGFLQIAHLPWRGCHIERDGGVVRRDLAGGLGSRTGTRSAASAGDWRPVRR